MRRNAIARFGTGSAGRSQDFLFGIKNFVIAGTDLADKTDKSAAFVCTVACVLPDGREFFAEGKAWGEITDKASGKGGFGYDPIFLLPELGKTFADLTAEEKNAISHRGRAVEAFAQRLCEYIEK